MCARRAPVSSRALKRSSRCTSAVGPHRPESGHSEYNSGRHFTLRYLSCTSIRRFFPSDHTPVRYAPRAMQNRTPCVGANVTNTSSTAAQRDDHVVCGRRARMAFQWRPSAWPLRNERGRSRPSDGGSLCSDHRCAYPRGEGGVVGTRPWWLALSACSGAYWPLALEPSAMTSRHPYYCGHPHCRGHPPSLGRNPECNFCPWRPPLTGRGGGCSGPTPPCQTTHPPKTKTISVERKMAC